MNWLRICSYAACLFLAQWALGLALGLFSPNSFAWSAAGDLVSFLICAAIFAHFAGRQKYRPFLHAVLALLLYCVLSFIVGEALTYFIGSIPLIQLVKEWLSLIAALLVGVPLAKVLAQKPHEA